MHPEIQPDKIEPSLAAPESEEDEPVTRQYIMKIVRNENEPGRRWDLKRVADKLDDQATEIALLQARIKEFEDRDALEAETTSRRKPISKPNPTERFARLSDILASQSTVQGLNAEPRRAKEARIEPVVAAEEVVENEEGEEQFDGEEDILVDPVQAFSSRGRELRKNRRYD